MNKSASIATAAALAAITRDDAIHAASEVIAKDENPFIRLTATRDEVQELIVGIAETVCVIRDRALRNSASNFEGIVESLAVGPDQFAAHMLEHDADPEVDCQIICRSMILRSEGRCITEDQCEFETDKDFVAFENAFDEGIALAGSFIRSAAMKVFARSATTAGWPDQ